MPKRSGMGRGDGAAGDGLREGRLARVVAGGRRIRTNPHTPTRVRAKSVRNGPSRPRGDGAPCGAQGLPGAGQPVGRSGSCRCCGGYRGCRQPPRMGMGRQAGAFPAVAGGPVGPFHAGSAIQVHGMERRQFESWQVTSPKGRVTSSKRVGDAVGTGKRLKLADAALRAPGAGSAQAVSGI